MILQWYLFMNKTKLLYIRQFYDRFLIESTISNNGKNQYLSFSEGDFVNGRGSKFNENYHVSAIDFIYEEEEKDGENIATDVPFRVWFDPPF